MKELCSITSLCISDLGKTLQKSVKKVGEMFCRYVVKH